ncbi:TonB-dependent receptor plug domain-containing protein [Polaribacter aquimarinus]|uniref:TonB-dependent receptor n=1 Tax=Polaribacter aquimarinus TaxID=2100726 RepID=A0A2U2J9V7_9FLAO|nr:TonB-dependent receptor [Polaribacter aquimarinus]PWG05102.1 TonB-dependent receptor [Polaribacter aquimarinus]
MKKQFVIVSALALSFVSTNLLAQKKETQKEKVETLDEVVVTATKFSLKKENTGKVITKITPEQLKQNAGKNVIEILNTVVGIDVRGVNSNASEPRSIYIRGGRSRQVLVLIDGVPVTDQSAINQEFDLRLLAVSQIESIEILKGASSTLYGSGAATAVINIILKKASKDKISGSFETSFGTNKTANLKSENSSDNNQNVSINGTLGKFNFLGTFNISKVDGMSAAKSKTNAVFGEDGFYSKNALVKLGYKVNDNISVETFLNYDEFDYSFDAGAFADSNVNIGNQNQFRFGIKPQFKYNNGQLYVLASVNEVKRGLDQFNSFAKTLDNYQFNGRSLNVDLVNKYEFSEKIQLITGVNYQEHTNQTVTPFATIDKLVANFNTIDPYASIVYVSDYGLSVNVGGRLNIHNVYGNHLVYDGNLAYQALKKDDISLKLIASYSTAFIAPSLYQLYDGFAGNIDLKPESNKTIEAGFEAKYQDWIYFDAVYFNRKEEDAIIYDNTTFKYGNGSSDANGFEVSTKITPTDYLVFNGSYTLIDRDKFEGADDYIASNKLVAGVDITALENTFFNLTYRNVGERTIFDRWGSFGTAGIDVILPSYQVLDLSANYKLLDETVTFFGAVTNILNEDYDDVLGFSTRGRNYKIGVRLQF